MYKLKVPEGKKGGSQYERDCRVRKRVGGEVGTQNLIANYVP
jgi:hypothetical protein